MFNHFKNKSKVAFLNKAVYTSTGMLKKILLFLNCFAFFQLSGCGGGASPPAGIPAPVSSSITVTSPNSDGFVTVTGAPGAVPGGATVQAGNVTKGAVVYWWEGPLTSLAYGATQDSVTANADGSFLISTLEAEVGDTLRFRYVLPTVTSQTTDKIVPDHILLLSNTLTPRRADIDRSSNIGYITSGDGVDGSIFRVDITNTVLLSALTVLGEGDIQDIAVDTVQSMMLTLNDTTDNIIPFDLTVDPPTQQASVNINNPQAVAVATGGGFAVIAQSGASAISLFNTATLAVDCSETLADSLNGAGHIQTTHIAMDSNGGFDMIISVSLFDNDTNIITQSLVNGCAAVDPVQTLGQVLLTNVSDVGGLAVFNSGAEALVTDMSADRVLRVNLDVGVITATIDVGDTPAGIVVNPNNNMAYVVNSGENTMFRIDLSDNSVTSYLDPIGLSATDLAFNSSNDFSILVSPFDKTAIINELN